MSEHYDPPKLALKKAARVLKGQANVARLCGYRSRQGVAPYFQSRRKFPAEHCPVVEQATRAAGEVVTCEELRPDVPWAVLRGGKA